MGFYFFCTFGARLEFQGCPHRYVVGGEITTGRICEFVALKANSGAGAFDGFGVGEDIRLDDVIFEVLGHEDLVKEVGFDFNVFDEVVFFAAPFVVFCA